MGHIMVCLTYSQFDKEAKGSSDDGDSDCNTGVGNNCGADIGNDDDDIEAAASGGDGGGGGTLWLFWWWTSLNFVS